MQACKYDRASIATILEKLLITAEFEIEQATLAWQASGEYREGSADFSDDLIGRVAAEHDALPVHTLDRKAAQSDRFKFVDA